MPRQVHGVGRWDTPPLTGKEFFVEPGESSELQAALTAAVAVSTAAEPAVVRLGPGDWILGDSLTAQSATGLRILGAGQGRTRLLATRGWIADNASGGAGFRGLLDISGCNDVVVDGLTINAVYGDDGTIGGTSNTFAAILHDNMLGNLLVNNCELRGQEYSMNAGSNTNADVRVDLMNSRLFGNANTIRSGAEKWHIFSCDLRGTITDTGSSNTNGSSGLQFLGTGEFQVWGCHIHAEDQRASSGSTTAPVAGVRAPSSAGTSAQILGSTIHVHVENDAAAATSRFGAVDIGTNTTGTLILIGCELIYETGTMTQGVIGGVTTSTSAMGSQTVRLINCSIRDNGGSGGSVRGWLARGAIVAGTPAWPVIDISGSRWLDGLQIPFPPSTTVVGVAGTPLSASAALSSGTKTVLLLTDAGDTSETNVTFTNGSATVSGGSSFTTVFKVGQFIRRSADTDADWQRIKNIGSNSSITLEAVYGGTGGAGSTAKKGTPTIYTQPDSTYNVLVDHSANEVIYAGSKKPGSFILTSSDGASSSTVRWQITR